MSDAKLQDFVHTTLQLLQTERDEEVREAAEFRSAIPLKELQAKGIVLLQMRVQDISSGLGGRTMISFSLSYDRPLPAHKFSQGDIVGIKPANVPITEEMKLSGVVYRLNDKTITIACDSEASDTHIEEPVILFKLANDVTFNRMKKAMEEIRSLRVDHPSYRLLQVIFGDAEPLFGDMRPVATENKNLNQPQLDAISFALSARDIALIHGPPGTGKTTTVVELIAQAVKQGRKVLACAPSNIAVDNLAERLVPYGQSIKFVRIGHPARILPSVIPFTLDSLISKAEGTEIVQDVKKELDAALKSFSKIRDKSDIFRLRGEVKNLRKELRNREKKVVGEIMQNVNVVLATNIGVEMASSEYLPRFDLVVIDEAAQALEASCWIPILKTSTLVLAGDHQQLPPTVKSKEAEKRGLGTTLFDRLNKLYGESVTRLLNIQYRMNEKIMKWSSDAMYDGKLVAHHSVANHLLTELPGVENTSETSNTLVFVDTAGCGFDECRQSYGDSTYNEQEVSVVSKYVACLIQSGLKVNDIAIITPYNAQVEKLREVIRETYPTIEIDTVDGFQGREKEAVVISLVRSNDKREVGFLSDQRRMNVAVTRARRHVALIGDSETISSNDFLCKMYEYFFEHGDYRSASSPEAGLSTLSLEDIDVNSASEGKSAAQGAESTTANKDGSRSQESKVQKQSDTKKKGALQGREQPGNSSRHSKAETPTEDTTWIAEFEKSTRSKIAEFLQSNEVSMQFPASLSSHQRFLVHQVCDEIGAEKISHSSQGEGESRFILVRKKPKTQEKVEHKKQSAQPKLQATAPDQSLGKDVIGKTRGANAFEALSLNDVDKSDEDADTHATVENDTVDRVDATGTSPSPNSPSPQQPGKKSNKGNKGGNNPEALKQAQRAKEKKEKDDLEFEQILKEFDPTKCPFPKCGKSTNMMGVNCMHCRKRYCFGHSMPETHGCGNAAKQTARTEWADRYAKAYQEQKQQALHGGPSEPKPLKGWQREVVQKKLHEKIEKAETNRKAGDKPKKK